MHIMAPLKLAISGGGASSFYVASRLLSTFPQSDTLSSQLRVHVYDRLWAPHTDSFATVLRLKNCTHKFRQRPCLRFFGNVQVGPQTLPTIPHVLPISLSSLKSHYIHPLFSTCRAVPTLHPALSPSDCAIPTFSLGNVAHMLLTPPAALAKYDVPVLDVLRRSAVRHELRELTALDGTSMLHLAPELLGPPTSDAKLSRHSCSSNSSASRLNLAPRAPRPGRSTSSARPRPSPLARQPAASEHRRLDASARAVPTGVTSGTTLTPPRRTSIRGSATCAPGAGGAGRRGAHVAARLCVRVGAHGVLASTMLDAYGVTDSILADYDYDADAENSEDALVADDTVDLESVPVEVEEGVRARRILQYDQWKKIDAEEVRRGAEMDKDGLRGFLDEVSDDIIIVCHRSVRLRD
ncbi:FAD/NAD-P-binding domain-containing protein [Lactarius pseudohatsudake]|nr:FAD/NAD-P-binding domain-containing protein [Lactarius pseudohatsudake]